MSLRSIARPPARRSALGISSWIVAAGALFAVSACDGEQGPPGKDGPPGLETEESVSGVVPARVFRDRVTTVVVSGDDTTWVEGEVELDFGPGVLVEDLTVASPTSLTATVRVEPGATLGARDVVVEGGAEPLVYSGGFTVDAAVASTFAGPVHQGGIARTTIQMLDPSTPFDLTKDGTSFTHLDVLGDGVTFVVEEASLFELSGLMLIDVQAEPGARDLAVTSGAGPSAVTSTLSSPVEVAARTAAPLDDGESGMSSAGETQLYVYEPGSTPTLVTLSVTTDAVDVSPAFALLPATGSYGDLIDFDDAVSFVTDGSAAPYYVAFFDNAGSGSYEYTFSIVEQSAPDDLETEANDTCPTADAITPQQPMLGWLGDAADVDLFVVEATASDVGRVVHVVTSPGESTTDTLVEVLRADCSTTMGGPSFDGTFHEDHLSSPVLAAGPIFVRVTQSSFGSAGSSYLLTVAFEDP